MSKRKCDNDYDMTGRTVLITGASAGIGKATAEDLARKNARIILACRNMEKANKVAREIISSTGNTNIIVKHLDLSSLTTVRKCAEDVLKTEGKLHVLINNAGILRDDKRRTEDGYDTVMQTNHLGHFLLTLSLLDLLKKSAPSRIINVSSMACKYAKLDINDMNGRQSRNYISNYSRSKLANVLFTVELASRLQNSGVTVNAVHPGFVITDIFVNRTSILGRLGLFLLWPLVKSAEEGAQTTVHVAVHPDLEKTTGKYFSNCREEKLPRKVLNEEQADKLFQVSEKMADVSFQELNHL